jgi:hypothetical protein
MVSVRPWGEVQVTDRSRFFTYVQPACVFARCHFRSTGLLLMLEHGGTPTSVALSALQGWGGDQFASWQAGKRRWCLRDTVVMDDPSRMDAFRSALSQWISRRDGKAKIDRTAANKTTFITCG